MSNRLEELSAKYQRYLFKRLVKTLAVFGAFVGLVLGAYFFISTDEKVEVVTKQLPKKHVSIKSTPSYALDVSSSELDKAVEKIQTNNITSHPPVKKTVVKKIEVKAPIKEKVVTSYFDENIEEQALQTWINKYNQKKSYSAAIYISKQYYAEKDFKQSGIWAKRANQLDRDKEEAWLYYAKSMYALGDQTKAKKILNIFLQYKKSLKAELLLSEWSQ